MCKFICNSLSRQSKLCENVNPYWHLYFVLIVFSSGNFLPAHNKFEFF